MAHVYVRRALMNYDTATFDYHPDPQPENPGFVEAGRQAELSLFNVVNLLLFFFFFTRGKLTK